MVVFPIDKNRLTCGRVQDNSLSTPLVIHSLFLKNNRLIKVAESISLLPSFEEQANKEQHRLTTLQNRPPR